MIHTNPFFVNPNAGDYHTPGSGPLINSGFNGVVNVTIRPFDIDGALRITNPNGGGIVDLGADEH